MIAKLRKGDPVVVIAGKDKGKSGKIIQVFPAVSRVLVENVNLVKKHVKANPSQQDKPHGLVMKEASIHISNVLFKNPETGKPERLGFKTVDGVKRRFCKSSGLLVEEKKTK